MKMTNLTFLKLMCSTSMFVILLSILGFYWSLSGTDTTHNTDSLKKPAKCGEKSTLIIGITSSPDHFQLRQSLRNTWLQLLPDSFNYRFLIGRILCDIHPSDRFFQYICDELNISITKGATENTLIDAIAMKSKTCQDKPKASMGFSFHVHHPIVIQFLGIKSNITVQTDVGLARIVLTDLLSLSRVSSVTFDGDSLKYAEIKGFIFKKLNTPVLLPKGFEGSVTVEGVDENSQNNNCHKCFEWMHGNLFSVLDIFTKDSTRISSSCCVLSTFSFTIKDLDQLRSHIDTKEERMVEWSLRNQEVTTQLQQEAAQYKDILFLDMVDVYRNLPQKVLHFFKWVYKNCSFKYVLKTDDDTFIDIPTVKKELDKTSDWDWWSCFRIGWPVHKHGKWRETEYQGEVYPPFPSGAGYVLSERAVAWLNSRGDNLSVKYQGEDVAVGIWLEALNASRHVGNACYWACNENCHVQTCNTIQLSVQDMYTMWLNYKKCGDKICDCPGPS